MIRRVEVAREIGALPGETMRAYAARLTHCPKCGAAKRTACHTKTGRNHSERVRAAIVSELEMWAELLT